MDDQAVPGQPPPAWLSAGHAFVLLDALSALRTAIGEYGARPWDGWQQATRPGDAPTEAQYRVWMRQARDVLATVLDAHPPAVLVPHPDTRAACAALHLRSYPAEGTDRSECLVVDLHGVSVYVQRRADHTSVELTTDEVPEAFSPVRVFAAGTELTDRGGSQAAGDQP